MTDKHEILRNMNTARQIHGDIQDHFFEQAMHDLMSDPSGRIYSFHKTGRERVSGSVRKTLEGHDNFKVVGEKYNSHQLTLYYSVPSGVMEVAAPHDYARNNASIEVTTMDLQTYRAIHGIAEKTLFREPKVGEVKILVQAMGGFKLQSIGVISSALERDNYSDEVLSKYDHVAECLGSASPCGRLTILEGPPGTGKSYLIRALIRDVRAHYILIPCMLLGQLSGPTLLPVLLEAKEDDSGEVLPVVLLVEDADIALVNREHGDASKLSEMLNLGDGLLGELGDLRIVATTNAKRVDIDEAALRPGRLCRHVAVKELNGLQANRVYAKLTGTSGNPYIGPNTLAKVYSDARNDGWRPRKTDEKPTGQYL